MGAGFRFGSRENFRLYDVCSSDGLWTLECRLTVEGFTFVDPKVKGLVNKSGQANIE